MSGFFTDVTTDFTTDVTTDVYIFRTLELGQNSSISLGSSSNFITPTYLPPDDGDLRYFKIRFLL